MGNTDYEYNRLITKRGYVFYFLITLAILLIAVYFIRWQQIKTKEKTSTDYLVRNNYVLNQVNSIQELKQVIAESPSRLILILSYHNSRRIYNIEKEISSTISKYDIIDSLYIYDFTKLKDKVTNYKEILDDTLDIDASNYPVIIIYEDGQITSYKSINNKKDVQMLFDKYNIEKK